MEWVPDVTAPDVHCFFTLPQLMLMLAVHAQGKRCLHAHNGSLLFLRLTNTSWQLNSLNIDLWDDVDSLVDLSGEIYIADQSINGVKRGTFRGK